MITEEMLSALRSDIENKMSEKRFRHTAEVERMVALVSASVAKPQSNVSCMRSMTSAGTV